MKVNKRYFAKKKVAAQVRADLEGISENFASLIENVDNVEVVETDIATFLLLDGQPYVMKVGEGYFPTVKGALAFSADRRYVTVDQGAVKFVTSGADIMRPGIVEFDKDIKKGDLVIVNEERHKKALAIGVSLWDGEEFIKNSTGKCIKNIHYVGDNIWNIL